IRPARPLLLYHYHYPRIPIDRVFQPIHRDKSMRPLLLWIVLLAHPWNWAWGQTLTRRPERPTPASSSASRSQPAPTLIPLSVPTGTPLKVALDQEVRVQKVG